MIEAVAAQCGDAILEYSATGEIRGPSGNRHPLYAPHNVYLTADEEWIAISAESDEAFSAFSRVSGIHDERFATAVSRKELEADVDAAISAWTSGLNLDDVCDALERTGVTFSPVCEFESVYRAPSEQYAERGYLVPIEHPECGTHYYPLNPWIYANTDRGSITHSPCFGQHSKEVFANELGLRNAQYDELETRGVTGTTKI